VLREFVAEDEAAVHEYASDPEVTRLVGWGPNTIEQTREFLAQITEPHDGFGFAITLRSTGQLVGSIGIGICSQEHRRGELGYVIHRAHWSQGYATEATLRVVRFGFDELDLHRIEATCHPDNGASARVLERPAPVRGPAARHMRLRGQWRDSLLCAVVRGR